VKKVSVLLTLVVFASLVFATVAQAAGTGGSKPLQIYFNVTAGYKITRVTVDGPNQFGNRTTWAPPDSTGTQKVWKNGVCESGAFSVCPDNIFTKDYWWTGKVNVSFRVRHWYDANSVREGTCEVSIPQSSWFTSISVTYDPERNTCTVR